MMSDMEERVCNSDCNRCPVILHPNSRMVTKIINELYDKFGEEVNAIIINNCPNMTVCYDCRIDDLTHVVGCKLVDWSEENE